MKNTVFKGMATALVTPMTPTGVDWDSLARFIDFQLENGINALVAVGTTGESATLSPEERKAVIRFTVQRVNGQVPVIAGVGTNNTEHVLEYTRSACGDGADALLVVTPYYNKATPKGLIQNFINTAEATDKPIILYNVPSRTGVNIPISVYKELAKHERIVAVKEASGNLSSIAQIFAECGDALDVYSGNDDQIVPIMSLGGKGVISVVSGIIPRETHDICAACLAGDFKTGAELQLKYLKLINTLFCEVNPIPVKAASGLMGLCSGELRLPLCDPEPESLAKISAALKEYGLL